MSQHGRQQEISLIGSSSKHELQQENNGNSVIENQSGGQDDGVDSSKHWNAIMFLLSCVIVVLCVDPWFLYVPMINQDDKCLTLDKRLMITALCFRSVFDMIYVGKIIWEYISHTKDLMSYFKYAIDILVILPIPEVLLPIISSKMTSSRFLDIRKLVNLFIVFFVLQYALRVIRLYQSWKEYTKTQLPNCFKKTQLPNCFKKLCAVDRSRKLWIKVAFNIFLYLLASHVVGGLWYFFSIQREMACWYQACENHIGCNPSSFKCGRSLGNYIFIDDVCPIQTPNTTLVDFGIFLEALQSGTVSSTNIPQKIMYCFWWGLRNLSSYGSNLQTSTYLWENCFAVFISIYGLIMFLLFIGNAETYMQMANEKAQKMRLKETNTESWMATNQLPGNMKKSIITCIRDGPEENKDFDTNNPISYISRDEKLMIDIKCHLCLPALQKIGQILNNKSKFLLQLICESLKPMNYSENSYIFQEGEPLNMMIFITQGSLWCFKTNNGENGEGTASNPQCIEKGDFYGEELLKWVVNYSPSLELSNLPISKTVKTLTKVEAFTLTVIDWKNIVSRAEGLGPSQSASWRYYKYGGRFATIETSLQAQTVRNDTFGQQLEAILTSIGVSHASPSVQQS